MCCSWLYTSLFVSWWLPEYCISTQLPISADLPFDLILLLEQGEMNKMDKKLEIRRGVLEGVCRPTSAYQVDGTARNSTQWLTVPQSRI